MTQFFFFFSLNAVSAMTLGKLSNWFLVSWGRNADVFDKQQFYCCFANYTLPALAFWTK